MRGGVASAIWRAQSSCVACDEGHACEAGAASQTPCGTGTSASANSGSCGQCAAGTFQDTVAQGSCNQGVPARLVLSAGFKCADHVPSWPVPEHGGCDVGGGLSAVRLCGHACASNSTSATEVQCAAGMYAQCSGGECELY